jgi:hypothetical protein
MLNPRSRFPYLIMQGLRLRVAVFMRLAQLVMSNSTRRKLYGSLSLHPRSILHYILLTINSIKKELSRLERNKERRHAREKQKGIFRASAERDAGSPSETPAPSDKPIGTTRKCANCGQAGHIKTNKKYCYQYCYTLLNLLFMSYYFPSRATIYYDE